MVFIILVKFLTFNYWFNSRNYEKIKDEWFIIIYFQSIIFILN